MVEYLQQLDLLVTIDIRWSETARASDFVLPDVTYLEADRGVGTVTGVNDARVFYRNAVLPVQHDDTRPGREIFAGLAAACGVGECFDFTSDDLAAARWRRLGLIWTSSRSAVGPIRAWSCRRARVSRRFPGWRQNCAGKRRMGTSRPGSCTQLDRSHGGARPGDVSPH
ncbi:MAG: molybdopterin-dependent oxidoreductase [Collinsella sp.]